VEHPKSGRGRFIFEVSRLNLITHTAGRTPLNKW